MKDRQARALRSVIVEVMHERCRQHEKWGQQNHCDGTGSISNAIDWQTHHAPSVFAEICKEKCREAAAAGEVTYAHILLEEVAEAFAESDAKRLRAELLQVAATAVQWVEAIDRRGGE